MSEINKLGQVTSNSINENTYYNRYVTGNESYSYKPTAGAGNSCLGGFGVMYDQETGPLKLRVELDVEWLGGFKASEGLALGMWIQGILYDKTSSSWKWGSGTTINTVLNNTMPLITLVTGSASGTYHYDVIVDISETLLLSWGGLYVGIRTDYSDGSGWIKISNLKIYKFSDILLSELYKIGNDYITANNLIEI